MLLEFRKVTRGAFASIILGLIGFAMVLFLIPRQGISNPFGQYLAKVGGTEITPAQLTRAIDVQVSRARQRNPDVTREDAIAQGVHMELLQQLIDRAAMVNYAERNGVSASDAQVASDIRSIPDVNDPANHQFDPRLYAIFLANQQYTRPEFEKTVRDNLTASMMVEALAAGLRAPSSFGAIRVAVRSETRTVTVAQAPISLAGNVPHPTDAQLQSFYDEIKDNLKLPEFRQVTLVMARTEDFAKRANITDEQVRAEFDRQAPSMGTPEKRSSVRIVTQNQAQAEDVAARINGGQSPDAVAQALHLQVLHGTDEVQSAVTDPAVAQAVFSMAANAPARAVQGQLSWVVVKTTAVTPGVTPDFAAHRDEIRHQLETNAAGTLVSAALRSYEETRGTGASVAQSAQTAGLAVVNIPAVESHGGDMHGQPVQPIVGSRNLLKATFDTAEGEESDFIQTPDGEVLVAVDHITPPHTLPLADMRDNLIQGWIRRETTRRMTELVDQVTQAAQHGQDFAAAARAHHMQIVRASAAMSRQEAAAIPARGVGDQIFTTQANTIVNGECARPPQQPMAGMCAHGDEFLIVRVERINRTDPATVPQIVERFRAEAQQEIQQSLVESVEAQVSADQHPQQNMDVINRTYPRPGQNGQGGDQDQ
jgi:peptidyl-prolyl cis-trans isomerase D